MPGDDRPTSAAAAKAAASAPDAAPAAAAGCGAGGKKSPKGGSTTVAVDDRNKKITIETNMEFAGAGATEEYAAAAKKQIEETWSGKCKRNGADYDVVVKVNTKVRKAAEKTPDYDEIVVDDSVKRMNQTLFGAGPGHQAPAAAADKERPRRIAHEYGHTLGLEDGYEETRTGCRPKDPTKKNDIMSETWPDKDGNLPHPHQDHYDQVLKNYGW